MYNAIREKVAKEFRELTETAMPTPITVPLHLTVDAVLYPDADGGYMAEAPALPGCYSEGDTLEDATANIREAAEAWLAAAHDHATRAALSLSLPVHVLSELQHRVMHRGLR